MAVGKAVLLELCVQFVTLIGSKTAKVTAKFKTIDRSFIFENGSGQWP